MLNSAIRVRSLVVLALMTPRIKRREGVRPSLFKEAPMGWLPTTPRKGHIRNRLAPAAARKRDRKALEMYLGGSLTKVIAAELQYKNESSARSGFSSAALRELKSKANRAATRKAREARG